MACSETPRARFPAVEIASAVPASATNVGAQRCVIHRVRKGPGGSTVPTFHDIAESAKN